MKFIVVCLTVCGPSTAFSWLLMQWALGCNSILAVGYFTLSECSKPALNFKWSARSTIQFLIAASIQSWLSLDAVGSSSLVWAFTLVQGYCQWRYLKTAVCLIRYKSDSSNKNLRLLRHLQV